MGAVRSRGDAGERDRALSPPVAGEPESAGQPPAWEEIELGRYMPRRIRGSFRGRELG